MIQSISNYMQKLVKNPNDQILIDAEDVTNECFLQIFHRLDNKSLLNCMLTCHRFEELIEASGFWAEHARLNGYEAALPSLAWKRAAHQKKFQGNENGEIDTGDFNFDLKRMALTGKGYAKFQPDYLSYFETARQHTARGVFRSDDVAIRGGGDGIQMELTSGIGCEPHPDVSKCLAFSYSTGSVHIFIDLVAIGIDTWVLDHVRPKIRITQKVNHRNDCSARLHFAAQLNYHETQWVHEKGHQQQQRNCDNKRFKSINKEWEQWQEANWEDFSLEFDDYPSGMRHLTVLNEGKDGLFWRGFYGPKIANIEIQVILPEEPVIKPLEQDLEKGSEDEVPIVDSGRMRPPTLRMGRFAYGIPPAPFVNPDE